MNDTPKTWRIQNPSVTLYAFHLRDEITKGNQQAMDNADQLWEQCIALGEQRDILILKSLKTELRSYTYNHQDGQYYYNPANEDKEATETEKFYLDNWLDLIRKRPQSGKSRYLRFHSDSEENGLRLLGEIYPLRIHDTYAIDLTLRYQETIDFVQLNQLNPTDQIQASIGQTLLLFAKPVNVPESAYQDFANQCVAALVSETVDYLKPSAVGKLFGSPIFEYENDRQNLRERHYILVWLGDDETRKQSEAIYHALLDLLCCRNKIIFTYHQSRLCNDSAWKLSSHLEQTVNELIQSPEETLEELKHFLKTTLETAFNHAKYLRDIKEYKTTIATNIQNYSTNLEKIKKRSLVNDDLAFLQIFLHQTCQQFQKQIQVDLNYRTPSQTLFQQMTDTVRGMVEIDQAERDRISEEAFRESKKTAQEREQKLQLWIALVGTGLAVSGISSQVESTPVETILNYRYRQPNQPPICPAAGASTCILYSFLDVMIHVFVGVAAALLLRLIVKLKR
jgi:hypothetical protein